MIQTKKIKNLEVKPPNDKKAFAIKTPKNLPKLHQLLLVIGQRGTGKGVATTSLVKKYVDAGCINHVILISPTYKSNEALYSQFGSAFDPDTSLLEPSKEAPKMLEQMIQDLADEHQQYLNDLQEYKDLKKKLKNGNLDEFELEDLYEREMLSDDLKPIKPEPRFPNGEQPKIYCIIDDVVGSDILIGRSQKELTQILLKHRHMGEMNDGVLGFSCALQSQTLKTQSGGIPRAIRENATQLMLIQKTKDEGVLKNIYGEIANTLTEEEFDDLYNMAVDDKDPHDFFFIDFFPKCPTMKYRKNLNTFMILEKDKKNCKCKKK